MSQTRICLNIERPDVIDNAIQGYRGPFAPVLMALEYLVDVNLWQLKQREYPSLYKSGIYYKTTPPATEWHDIPSLLRDGFGDCKDLVAYRVAELRSQGIECKPCIKWKMDKIVMNGKLSPILLIHVMVLHRDNSIEDPSAILGMGGEYQ